MTGLWNLRNAPLQWSPGQIFTIARLLVAKGSRRVHQCRFYPTTSKHLTLSKSVAGLWNLRCAPLQWSQGQIFTIARLLLAKGSQGVHPC